MKRKQVMTPEGQRKKIRPFPKYLPVTATSPIMCSGLWRRFRKQQHKHYPHTLISNNIHFQNLVQDFYLHFLGQTRQFASE